MCLAGLRGRRGRRQPRLIPARPCACGRPHLEEEPHVRTAEVVGPVQRLQDVHGQRDVDQHLLDFALQPFQHLLGAQVGPRLGRTGHSKAVTCHLAGSQGAVCGDWAGWRCTDCPSGLRPGLSAERWVVFRRPSCLSHPARHPLPWPPSRPMWVREKEEGKEAGGSVWDRTTPQAPPSLGVLGLPSLRHGAGRAGTARSWEKSGWPVTGPPQLGPEVPVPTSLPVFKLPGTWAAERRARAGGRLPSR